MEEYIRVKELIASNQTKDDFCILNYEDEELRKFAPKCPATVVFFSSVQKLEEESSSMEKILYGNQKQKNLYLQEPMN